MKIIIQENPVSKKNSQRLVYAKGRIIPLPSKQYKDFEKACGKYLQQTGPPITTPVNIKCEFYMKTKRRVDQVNLLEAVDDVLVTYHVIEDDNRDIVAGHDGSRVLYDKENPRIEIDITPMEDYLQWKEH